MTKKHLEKRIAFILKTYLREFYSLEEDKDSELAIKRAKLLVEMAVVIGDTFEDFSKIPGKSKQFTARVAGLGV